MAGNTVTKLWGLLRHRLLLSLRLGRKVLPQDNAAGPERKHVGPGGGVASGHPAPEGLASARPWSVYHVRGFTQSFSQGLCPDQR